MSSSKESIYIVPGQEPYLAPGVRGYTVEQNGELYVPLIIADRPGSGDVGRYLDSLPRDRTVKFPNVLSERLEQMLLRRGFHHGVEYSEEWGIVPILVRHPQKEKE